MKHVLGEIKRVSDICLMGWVRSAMDSTDYLPFFTFERYDGSPQGESRAINAIEDEMVRKASENSWNLTSVHITI